MSADDRGVVLRHRSGATSRCRDLADLRALVDELDQPDDPEHPDVAVAHPSGWTLSAFSRGLVIWEDVESDDVPSHREGVSRDEVKELFALLVGGELDAVASSPWRPGYASG